MFLLSSRPREYLPKQEKLGRYRPGCFAEQFIAPAEFVWPIPDAISDEDAVTEFSQLAVSLHALWQSGTQIGDTVAVIGCSKEQQVCC